ncbi:PLP-dependent aminotransferase family protein [Ideonella sp.]|uniref:aminotransferase-like domain-containing protein n=1 Tax=Ideonella sp. TaxID=1929293 RepID=UPI003BB71FF2
MQHSYAQLAQRLKHDLQRQRHQAGDKLPSVRQLATSEGVSTATVVRCYRLLETEGYVEVRAKSGMYVADWKAQQAARRTLQAAADATTPPPVRFEQLASLQHRMSQLHALTAQPLTLALHLADAEPGWYPCEALARAGQRLLRREPQGLGTYLTGTGLPALKKALIGHLARSGMDLGPADLLVTSGATEALQLALRAVTRPGDTIAVESPVYFGILQAGELLGLKMLEIPCVAGQGMSLEALEYALAQHGGVRAVVVMPNFQNPLGTAMPDAAKQRLLGLAERHGATLIEDDAFGDLAPGLDRPRPIKAWDRHGQVIYCGCASKSMAPALRVGWVVGGRHQRTLESLKFSNSLTTPWFEQAVLAEYMVSGAVAADLRRLRERLAATVPPATEAVRAHFPAGTRVAGPAIGWWLWIELPEGLDTMVLLHAAVRHGLAFTPGALFSSAGKFKHHLRLNIARPWTRELALGIKTLGALAQAAASHPAGAIAPAPSP